MPFFPVDDDFNTHPKLVGIRRGAPRERAAGLWGIAGSWCAKWLTGGAISGEQIEELGCTRASAEALVAAGLWHAHGHACPLCPQPPVGGYQFHEWSAPGRNPTREQVLERRAKKAAAGAQGGRASGQSRRARSKPEASASPERSTSEASASELVEPPYLSSSLRSELAPARSGSPLRSEPAETAQTLIAEWIDHCDGGRPPGRVVGQVAKELGQMLDEGIPYADVRRGLAAWHGRGLHPSTLASVVHETRNPPRQNAARMSPGDRALALVADYQPEVS